VILEEEKMKIWQCDKRVLMTTKLKTYKLFNVTLLTKEYSPNKIKYKIFGIKFTKKRTCISKPLNLNELFETKSFPNVITSITDIIIPIYNGYEYLPGLFQGIKENTDAKYRLIVIDDCSVDKRVRAFLKQKKREYGADMILLFNEENAGFVKTVNKGLALSENNVVLLNTDVILPKNWLSRLISPLLQDKRIASVTPFSNAATIFSLPEICKDNVFSEDLEQVNKALSKINIQHNRFRFPTGVGFCMALSKRAIQKTGFLDEVFEKGYGEENDWCQRAIKQGFYHTIAANLFVWHKHGGSFDNKEKQKLIQKHLQILQKRYPCYNTAVQYALKDEKYALLHFIAEVLYFNAVSVSTELWLDHSWGRGTETYTLNNFENLKEQKLCLRLQSFNYSSLQLTYYYKNYSNSFIFNNLTECFSVVKWFNLEKVVVNNLASYQDPAAVLEEVGKLKKSLGVFVSFRAHDYQCICPNICMLNKHNKYCACAHLSECEHCLASATSPVQIKFGSIKKYHNAYQEFFANTADEVIVFSLSSQEIYERLYPETKGKIVIILHKIKPLRLINTQPHKTINIAVLGAINESKGADIVKEIDSKIKDYDKMAMIVIGNTNFGKLKNIKIHGQYNRDNLPEIMENYNIDMVFIPSVWPETFSYTTSEAMSMGLPVACFNLGAPAERVKTYPKGVVISDISADAALNEIQNFFN